MRFFIAPGFLLVTAFTSSHLQSINVLAQTGNQQQAPHVHGTAQLTLVQDRSTLLIEFESPAINIVGFEHAPRDTSQREAINEALHAFRAPDSIVLLSALNCEILHTLATTTGVFSEHSHAIGSHTAHSLADHTQDHSHTHEHAGFRVIFELSCPVGFALAELGITAFASFQGIQTIEAQWALDRAQGARRLSNQQNRLRFE
jgi:hypothetical protein